jgi:hypothetical protein
MGKSLIFWRKKKPMLPLSLSLDLDNTWSYLKIHGDPSWSSFPSHFPLFFPIVLDFLKSHNLNVTFFIVGQDAEIQGNQTWFQRLERAGHDVGNHSFHHEPWMQKQTENEIVDELKKAHEAIANATGMEPIGFRGPGFCHSPQLLNALTTLGYRYDASLLATVIGPLARLYYMATTKTFKKEEKEKRDVLFGSFSNSLLPNTPFLWKTAQGNLLEVPVTTMPLFRTPIHLSYLIWLSRFSRKLAWAYLKCSIALCKWFQVSPSLLLHPPDFMGAEDLPALSFFPGMDLPRSTKLSFVRDVIQELKQHFTLISLNQHAAFLEDQRDLLKKRER